MQQSKPRVKPTMLPMKPSEEPDYFSAKSHKRKLNQKIKKKIPLKPSVTPPSKLSSDETKKIKKIERKVNLPLRPSADFFD